MRAALFLALGWLATLAGAKPNIVHILADDLGPAEIGPFGQRLIPTPRLDQMAREGLCFDRTYAGSAVCAPSRTALLTGLHTGQGPIRANKEHPNGQHPLPGGIPTVARSLKAAGYATGCFGKWGMGYPGLSGLSLAPTLTGRGEQARREEMPRQRAREAEGI